MSKARFKTGDIIAKHDNSRVITRIIAYLENRRDSEVYVFKLEKKILLTLV